MAYVAALNSFAALQAAGAAKHAAKAANAKAAQLSAAQGQLAAAQAALRAAQAQMAALAPLARATTPRQPNKNGNGGQGNHVMHYAGHTRLNPPAGWRVNYNAIITALPLGGQHKRNVLYTGLIGQPLSAALAAGIATVDLRWDLVQGRVVAENCIA